MSGGEVSGGEVSGGEVSESGESEWEVEKIDAFRRVGRKRGRLEYRVVWKGGESTWEPKQSFRLKLRLIQIQARIIFLFLMSL